MALLHPTIQEPIRLQHPAAVRRVPPRAAKVPVAFQDRKETKAIEYLILNIEYFFRVVEVF